MTSSQNILEPEPLSKARRGDRNAMGELYCSSVGYLTAVCSRYIADNDEVKDILQESYIKIFSSLDKFEYRGEGSLKAWMKRIVINGSLKFIRDRKTFNVPLEGATAEIPEDEDTDFDSVPVEIIHQMIKTLPDGYRTVFNLHVIEGLPHKEIARILGIKEDTSASQLLRAKASLAKQIKQYKLKHQL